MCSTLLKGIPKKIRKEPPPYQPLQDIHVHVQYTQGQDTGCTAMRTDVVGFVQEIDL